MNMITIAFNEQELSVLAGLITAGAKSPQTGSEAIMHGAALLQKLQQAANKAVEASKKADEVAQTAAGKVADDLKKKKPNGHAEART